MEYEEISSGLDLIPRKKSTIEQLLELGTGQPFLFEYTPNNQMLYGYISNLESEEPQASEPAWDKNGNVYYTDNPRETNYFELIKNRIKAQKFNTQQWINETDSNSVMYKEKTQLVSGLTALPFGLENTVSQGIASRLTPYLGSKISRYSAQGITGGFASGAIEGGARGIMDSKNPINTAFQDATTGALTGGITGYGIGRFNQYIHLRHLEYRNLKDESFINDYYKNYVEGLNNPKQQMSELRRVREGISSKGAKQEILNDTPDNSKDLPLYERLKRVADDLKRGKYNPLKYKGKSVSMDNINPAERDYIISEITSNMSKDELNQGFATRRLPSKDGKDYMYNLIYDKDGMHKIKKYEVTENDVFNR